MNFTATIVGREQPPEPGTKDFALGVSARLERAWHQSETNVRKLIEAIDDAEKGEAWKWFPSSKPCQTADAYAAFVFELPTWADVKSLAEVAKSIGGETVAKVELQTMATNQRVTAAAANTTGEVLGEGRPKRERANLSCLDERARSSGVSRATQHKLDRLARDFAELHALVVAGKMSCNAAAIEAGIVKVKSPLEKALDAFRKLEPTERAAFLKLI